MDPPACRRQPASTCRKAKFEPRPGRLLRPIEQARLMVQSLTIIPGETGIMRFVHVAVAAAFTATSLYATLPAQAHHHNNAGAFVGGLIAGAVLGGAAAAAEQPRPYYYPPYPPYPPPYGYAYPPYCGYAPYPPC
jgi:hypothetical protein